MLGCVIMAAGNAVRFGANKLEAELDGKPLIRRAFEAVPAGVFKIRLSSEMIRRTVLSTLS